MKRILSFILSLSLICIGATTLSAPAYTLSIDNISSSYNVISFDGSLTPGVEYPLLINLYHDGIVIDSITTNTDSAGKFQDSFTVPQVDDTREYTITAQTLTKEENYKTIFSDDFSSDKSKSYIAYSITRDTDGSSTVAGFSGDSSLSYAYQTLSVDTTSKLRISVDFKKPSLSASTELIGARTYDGSVQAYKVEADASGNINLWYIKRGQTMTKAQIGTYTTNEWYNVVLLIDLATRSLTPTINGVGNKSYTYGATVTNLGEVFTSKANKSDYSLANLKIELDNALKIENCNASASIKISGYIEQRRQAQAKLVEDVKTASRSELLTLILDNKNTFTDLGIDERFFALEPSSMMACALSVLNYNASDAEPEKALTAMTKLINAEVNRQLSKTVEQRDLTKSTPSHASNPSKSGMVLEGYGVALSKTDDCLVTNGALASAIAYICTDNPLTEVEAIEYLRIAQLIDDDKELLPDAIADIDDAYSILTRALGASKLHTTPELLNGVSQTGKLLTYESAQVMLYNFLMSKCYELTASNEYNVSASQTRTALEVYLDGYRSIRTIQAVSEAAVTGYDSYIKEGYIFADGIYIYTNGISLDNYLGSRLELFVRDNGYGDLVLCAFFPSSTYDEIFVPLRDVSAVSGFDGSDALSYKLNPSITYDLASRSKSARLATDVHVLFNGSYTNILTNADFLGDNGTLSLSDTDGDGKYDVASITSYTAGKVAMINDADGKLAFDNGTLILYDNTSLTVEKGNEIANVNDVKVDAVVGVYAPKRDAINARTRIVIFDTIIKGRVSSLDTDNKTIIVDGIGYNYPSSMLNDLQVGRNFKLTIDTNGNVAYVERLGSVAPYSYYLKNFRDVDTEDDILIKTVDFTGDIVTYRVHERAIYTGYDESGAWVDRASVKPKKFWSILSNAVTNRQLIKISTNASGIVDFCMAKDMTGDSTYSGYDDTTFTLDARISASEGLYLRNNRCVTKNYSAESGSTMVFFDDISLEDEVKIVPYAVNDINTLSECAYTFEAGYVYDADSLLTSTIIVAQYNGNDKDRVTYTDHYFDDEMLISRVDRAVNGLGEVVSVVKGYINGKYTELYAVDDDVTQKSKTAWYDAEFCKVGDLKKGDIIIPITNAKGELECFYVLLKRAYDNTSEQRYLCYGDQASNQQCYKLNTIYDRVLTNYNNKVASFVSFPSLRFTLSSDVIYVVDSKKNEITVSTSGEYVYDSSTASADYVFIARDFYTPKMIVIYR